MSEVEYDDIVAAAELMFKVEQERSGNHHDALVEVCKRLPPGTLERLDAEHAELALKEACLMLAKKERCCGG